MKKDTIGIIIAGVICAVLFMSVVAAIEHDKNMATASCSSFYDWEIRKVPARCLSSFLK